MSTRKKSVVVILKGNGLCWYSGHKLITIYFFHPGGQEIADGENLISYRYSDQKKNTSKFHSV